jgi:hypothetical protein
MWYYALAHRPGRVREVMNLLISYSLLQSTAYPPASELDDHLQRLLNERNETLKRLASQDLEAAELLGKMLSGYASLRQYYEIRDGSSRQLLGRKQAAATALISVIASADDNIRGGLYDQTRDAIVSEDFLLALLGEATVFVSDPDNNLVASQGNSAGVVSLDQIDVLLKAVEDLQTIGDRVYTAADDFFHLVLASAPGGAAGAPSDLLTKSTNSLTGSNTFVLAGSSMLASQLQKLIGGAGFAKSNVKRGWDWRTRGPSGVKGQELLMRLRKGLTRDLSRLWLDEADSGVW